MDSQSLFRPQALISQQQNIEGTVLVRPTLSALGITAALLMWLAASLYWLLSSQYVDTQTVTGWLEPQRGITHVYSPSPGAIVSEILVNANQRVSKGTPLIKLTRDATFKNNQSVNAVLLGELKSRIERLQTQYTLSQNGFENKRQQLQTNHQRLLEDRQNIASMRTLLNQKMQLLDSQKQALTKLTKDGFYSKHQLQNLDAQRLDESYQHKLLNREWLAIIRAIDDTRYELQTLTTSHQLQQLAIENSISEIQQSLHQQYSVQDIVVTAPNDGKVGQLHAKSGQSTQANLPLLTLMPEQGDVIARLLIPISAAGQVSAGQPISLRYDAFPYTQFGTYDAVIDKVSPHLLLPQEVAQTPVTVKQPVYLASASLSSFNIEHLNEPIALRAGMTFAADINIRERNLMQWLFEPLYQLNGGLL
ncbi:HlyD family secretion protein [Alteromonas gilva]|uniref:HlyD family efflux transporter periplasmic adaptor subunit n=1 Tax=Alteromonas gilva TaxID=2987522 RepID=A0ABT5L7G5_9ALTE|nr:HlyD family efflux transporter periplasmic adaptor subunit [Alteromonas gilva]MDC8832359.1 HlyD family efflux transporter periplasmic adaptor subunit [Alteromonas gilva]